MGNPPGRRDDASTAEASTNLLHLPRECFVVQLQTASRAYLSKRSIRSSIPVGRLPRVSSASSLYSLTREARYARAESALRVAFSRCESEPSPLELQVRVLEKGLQAWNARAGRGYERVQNAEEALQAARRNQEGLMEARSSFSELQREKWMGMRERDEALEMVEKIKGLIRELNTDIMEGIKASPYSVSVEPAPRKALASAEGTLPGDIASRKAAILFSGKFPKPYLENLPRSRRSVEPLRLPLQITNHPGRQRSSTLRSEPNSSIASSTPTTTQPSTPHPATPTDNYGAAFIHTPVPLKSVAQYLAELEESGVEETQETRRVHDHTRLPSYVGALLDELSEDRIGKENFHIAEVLRPLTHHSSTISSVVPTDFRQDRTSPVPPLPNHKLRSKGLLGLPFGSPPSGHFVSRSPSQSNRSKENHDPSMTLLEPSIGSITASERVIHTFPNTCIGATPSSTPLTSPNLDAPLSSRKQHTKNAGRVGNLMESVRRGVKRVSRRE